MTGWELYGAMEPPHGTKDKPNPLAAVLQAPSDMLAGMFLWQQFTRLLIDYSKEETVHIQQPCLPATSALIFFVTSGAP